MSLTQLSAAGLPQSFTLAGDAEAVIAGSSLAEFFQDSTAAQVPEYTSLSVAGFPQTVFSTAEIGASFGISGSAVAAFAGASAFSASYAIAGTAATAGVGASTASAAAAIASTTTVAFASVLSSDGTFTIAGATTADFRQFVELTALGPFGSPLAFYEYGDKAGVTERIWAIQDTFTVGVEIGDFTDIEFDILDTFAFATSEEVSFPSALFALSGSATAAFVGDSTNDAAFSATASSAAAFAGQNVVVNFGTFTVAGSTTVAAQGATAGTTFGVGNFAIGGSAIGDFQAAQLGVASFSAFASSAAEFGGMAMRTGDFAIAGAAAADFTFTTAGAFASEGVGAAAFVAEANAEAAFSTQGVAVAAFSGQFGELGEVAHIAFEGGTNQIVLSGSSNQIVLRSA